MEAIKKSQSATILFENESFNLIIELVMLTCKVDDRCISKLNEMNSYIKYTCISQYETLNQNSPKLWVYISESQNIV